MAVKHSESTRFRNFTFSNDFFNYFLPRALLTEVYLSFFLCFSPTLQELFGEFGSLKKAAVHFSSGGKSQGSADIVFNRYQDAIRAMQKYNGVPLDGKSLALGFLTTAEKVSVNH